MRIQNSYFKGNDRVENLLADEARSGRMSLGKHGIASDWTQYLPAANRYCQAGGTPLRGDLLFAVNRSVLGTAD